MGVQGKSVSPQETVVETSVKMNCKGLARLKVRCLMLDACTMEEAHRRLFNQPIFD